MFKEYGKLFGQNIHDLEAGARIMIEEKKQDQVHYYKETSNQLVL